MKVCYPLLSAVLIATASLACSNAGSTTPASATALTYDQLFSSLSAVPSVAREASIHANESRSFGELLANPLAHPMSSVRLGDASFEMSADKLLRAQQVAKALDQVYPNVASFLAAADVDSAAKVEEEGMIATIRSLAGQGGKASSQSSSQDAAELGLVTLGDAALATAGFCMISCVGVGLTAGATAAIATLPLWFPVYVGTGVVAGAGLLTAGGTYQAVSMAHDAILNKMNPPPRLTYKVSNKAPDASCHRQPVTPSQCAQARSASHLSAEGLALGDSLPEEAGSALTVQALANMGSEQISD